MANRIYLVKNKNTGVERLVRAVSRSEAVRFVARTSLESNAASQDDLVRLVAAGTAIEDSKVLLGNDNENTDQE
jgi:hypothetical protein